MATPQEVKNTAELAKVVEQLRAIMPKYESNKVSRAEWATRLVRHHLTASLERFQADGVDVSVSMTPYGVVLDEFMRFVGYDGDPVGFMVRVQACVDRVGNEEDSGSKKPTCNTGYLQQLWISRIRIKDGGAVPRATHLISWPLAAVAIEYLASVRRREDTDDHDVKCTYPEDDFIRAHMVGKWETFLDRVDSKLSTAIGTTHYEIMYWNAKIMLQRLDIWRWKEDHMPQQVRLTCTRTHNHEVEYCDRTPSTEDD